MDISEGKNKNPSYGIVDSQSVKTIYNSGNIITDTLGNLLHVKLHPENWQDTTVDGIAFEECLNQYSNLMGLSADSGYRGTTVNQVTDILNKNN